MEDINNQLDPKTYDKDFKLIGKSHLTDIRYAQIISTISHELSTPLSILKSNIQLFKDYNSNMDEAIREESLYMCEESVENMVRFLANIQLLNTAMKIEIVPAYSKFSAKKIMYQQSKEIEMANLEYSRISIHWNLGVKLISSDLMSLQQIVANLLSNALKFSKEKVFLSISTTTEQICIIVQDSGIGIPEDELEMVFTPFMRSLNAKRIPGVGLGLSLVSTLTRSLRGDLYVSSHLNNGTTVKIILPNEN